jgi:hypothetical protein
MSWNKRHKKVEEEKGQHQLYVLILYSYVTYNMKIGKLTNERSEKHYNYNKWWKEMLFENVMKTRRIT